jgi:peptide/nickel transport system permease protein
MEVARIVRAQFLTLKEQEFVTAARSMGATAPRIMLRELLPNGVGPIIVAATLQVAAAILAESYISFLGYGIQPPQASWGIMLNNAQDFFTRAPWLAIFPGVAITLAVLAFNFIGDGLRDAFDPRQRVR